MEIVKVANLLKVAIFSETCEPSESGSCKNQKRAFKRNFQLFTNTLTRVFLSNIKDQAVRFICWFPYFYKNTKKQSKPIKSPNVKSELAPKCTFCLISMKQRIIFLRSMGGPRGSNIDWRGQNWKKFGWNVLWLKWFQRNIEETDRDGSFRADSTEKLESGRKLKNPKEKTDDDWNQEDLPGKEIYWHGSTVSGSFSTKVVLLTSKVISNLTDAWRRR